MCEYIYLMKLLIIYMGLLDAGQCTLWWARVCDCPLGRLGRIIGAEMGYEVGQDFSTTRLGTVVPVPIITIVQGCIWLSRFPT
jgi:hypothetical protein